MRIYLDTSALVKLVTPERESVHLLRWLDKRTDRSWVASALVRTELIRAVSLSGPGAFGQAEAVLARMDLVSVTAAVLDAAGRLGPDGLRSLDAIHVASALRCQPDLEAVVTYDLRMIDAVRLLGLPVAHPGRR